MLNQCQFIGHLGKDPEVRAMQNGDKVANLSIACTEKWKDKSGERKERTTWVPIVVWGPLAGIVEQYLHKGSKIFVQGKFSVRKWQDQSGADRYSTEVVLQGPGAVLTMLDGPKQDGGSGGGYGGQQRREPDGSQGHASTFGGGAGAAKGGFGDDLDDEVPFARNGGIW